MRGSYVAWVVAAVVACGGAAGHAEEVDDPVRLVSETPCLLELRMGQVPVGSDGKIQPPAGFTREQCEAAIERNARVEELRAQAAAVQQQRWADDAKARAARRLDEDAEREAAGRAIDREIAESRIRTDQLLARMEARQQAESAYRKAIATRPDARLGMTAAEVLNGSRWGRPLSVKRTRSAQGTVETWLYSGGRALVLQDGKLAIIHD